MCKVSANLREKQSKTTCFFLGGAAKLCASINFANIQKNAQHSLSFLTNDYKKSLSFLFFNGYFVCLTPTDEDYSGKPNCLLAYDPQR